ncbi:MAG: hypothetical protein ACJASG_000311 [Oleiphilaceae bacterium]|jgi:hypothetical protein
MWGLFSIWVVVALVLVMHFLMPKAVLKKYFIPPYFKPGECVIFTGIPYAPIRTIMLMRVLGFPKTGKKRGLTEAYKLAPLWYQITSKVLINAIFLITILLFLILLMFCVDLVLNK